MSQSSWVVDVGEAEFGQVVDASYERPVVIDFWAPWCQPCLALGPLLEKLVGQRNGQVLLAKVNVDEAPNLARHFQIQSIPAVKAVREGQIVLEFEGLLPEKHLSAFLDRVCEGAAPEAPEEDPRELERLDPKRAEQYYREALARDAKSDAARLGLARVLLARNEPAEVAELLEPVSVEGDAGVEAARLKAQLELRQSSTGPDAEAAARRRLAAEPDSAEARLELGQALAAKGQYEQALEMLMAAAERDYKLASTKVREAMVKVFYALGTDHPLSNDYRSRLARLLY
jgi:putative thioredoxin